MTVNAKALPAAIYPTAPEYKYEVTVGTLALTADGKYSVKTTYRQTITAGNIVSVDVDSSGGTWALTGTAVQFTNDQDGSKDNAVWDKDQLTFIEANARVSLSLHGPKLFASSSQTQVAARLSSAAVDPVTYVYKK